MGWGDVISIGLGLGNLAINSSNAGKLQQMKLQHAGEALYREFINTLRSGMFNLKQTTEGILAGEEASPLQAAGAMRILDYQLSASGVTPDLFPELADKEYAAATAKLISSNSNRMHAALDKTEQSQVDQLVQYVRQLTDCHYYLENADNADYLREAKSIIENGGRARLGCVLSAGLMLLGLTFLNLGDFGMLLALVVFVVALVFAVRYFGKRNEVTRAKKAVKEIEDDVDLERFWTLENQFKTPDQARQAQKQAEQYIESYFGDYTLLQDGWRS